MRNVQFLSFTNFCLNWIRNLSDVVLFLFINTVGNSVKLVKIYQRKTVQLVKMCNFSRYFLPTKFCLVSFTRFLPDAEASS